MTAPAAFVYDFLLVRGGAERLTLHVGHSRPDIDLVCGFIDRTAFPASELDTLRIRTLTGPSRVRGWQGLKTLSAFRRHGAFLKDYERVIFSGVYAPAGVRHRPGRANIYYCHTPPRFAYDLRQHYLQAAAPWQLPLLHALIPYVRREYEASLGQMDRVIANSRTVQRRLEQQVGISGVEVLYPPVDTRAFRWREDAGFFLSTARLEPYKRVDLVIEAFMRMPERKLVVASGGSEYRKLRDRARGHRNISFTGWQTDGELRRLIGSCSATVYIPREEDFGLSPVESMAAGKPVLAVDEGGPGETVAHGVTGWLLDPGALLHRASAIDAIVEGVVELQRRAAEMRPACESHARRFDQAEFDRGFARLLD